MGNVIMRFVCTALFFILSAPIYLSVLIQAIYLEVLKIICYHLKGIFKDIDPFPIYDKIDEYFEKHLNIYYGN